MNATEISLTAARLSSQQAATTIVALINSCPRSQRQDEIEAILTLHALELVRMDDDHNTPGASFHALAVLGKLGVEQVEKVRLAVFPEASSGHDGEAHP